MGPTPTAAVALPPAGRKGRPPKCPYELAAAGEAWWKWAWGTPQATQWDTGSLYTVGRRAQLEDSLAALDQFDPHALDWFFSAIDVGSEDAIWEQIRELGRIVGQLQALAGSRLAVAQKMAELDDRLGLSPKALAALKWAVTDGEPKAKGGLNEILAQRKKREAEAAG
jgi:hypothetical protein